MNILSAGESFNSSSVFFVKLVKVPFPLSWQVDYSSMIYHQHFFCRQTPRRMDFISRMFAFFHFRERIIEYCLENQNSNALANNTVSQFIRSVAARTPAPGGGSVAATVAALVSVKLWRDYLCSVDFRLPETRGGVNSHILFHLNSELEQRLSITIRKRNTTRCYSFLNPGISTRRHGGPDDVRQAAVGGPGHHHEAPPPAPPQHGRRSHTRHRRRHRRLQRLYGKS